MEGILFIVLSKKVNWELVNMTQSFNEFMAEEREISRWKVAIVFLTGMFAGAVLTSVYLLLAIL